MENNLESTKIIRRENIKAGLSTFVNQVYNWMTLALLITGLTAYVVADTPALVMAILSNKLLFYGLLIGELLLVGYLSGAINKLSAVNATALFLVYSAMNGLTFSVIFLIYTAESLAGTFFICAGTFAAMSLYGYYTKKDLTSIGNIAFMLLIGIIIASIANFFMNSEALYWIITYLGVFIFIGLIAYDTQKIKRIYHEGFESEETEKKGAILGALRLYLDFINLFLFLLRIFGRRK
ncbi:hypothetical protein C7S20_12425 [Christiangramia fulva]|uniref:BAX inhibitor (BI)-1/YccA family protein n=1 Tax=Christiangramia fulva TaxID=2126553 RepID=A0A2R3Z6Y2_9FLAO|nr:Bax inhibitor-1/YccA family protein [Christiangramia fulva]AVR45994.1 hypothetical protein C7S20_12425 [Christiangramia fulva]